MSLSRLLTAVVLTCSPITLLAAPAVRPATAISAPAPETVAQFTVGPHTEVPGHLLKEGSYKVAILDHLSDRMVLRVTTDDGKEVATFLGLRPDHTLPGQSGEGAILMTSGHDKKALRGFAFPDGTVAEFVYPKNEAVVLAKASDSTIPAVDPASEGMSANSDLSRSDMEMVTLWILTPTTVGPDSTAGIQAQRYRDTASGTNGTATAENSTQPTSAQRTSAQRTSAQTNDAQPYQVASNTPPAQPRRRAASNRAAALPHTASSLPAVLLVGFLSMLLACVLTSRRRGGWLGLR